MRKTTITTTILFSLALISITTTAANAKDYMLILSESEMKALVQVLDAGVKSSGLQAASATGYFFEKLKAAPEVTVTENLKKDGDPIAGGEEKK